MAEVSRKRVIDADASQHPRKKLRPSELPLSQAKRSAIDNLVQMFRKKGHYDSIRKELLAQYEASVCIIIVTSIASSDRVAACERRPPVGAQGLGRE